MAETSEARLPTAAYLDLLTAPGEAKPLEQLKARLRAASQLPQAESTIETGMGGLLLAFAHPSQTLAFARELISLARGSAWDLPPLRVGVHVAAMSKTGADAEHTISGSSIDGAVRIASLAEPNQALATAQFQTVVVHLLKIGAGLLEPLGKRTTASGKTLDVFEIVAAAEGVLAAPKHVGEPSVPSTLSEARIHTLEQMLAAEIGPIAKVLVKHARPHLPDQNRFLLHLAEAIPEPERRRAFLSEATRLTA